MTAPEQQPQEPAQAPVQDAGAVPDVAEDPAPASSREAAAHRVRARTAEAARDVLAERVARMQRAEVERLLTARLASPADLWLAGVELGEVLDDQGEVDVGKVDARSVEVLTAHPHWQALRVPDYDGGARNSPPTTRTFSDVLRSRT